MKKLFLAISILLLASCGSDSKFQIKEPGITVDVEVLSGDIEVVKSVLQAAVDSVQ